MTALETILVHYRATSQTEREKGTSFEELVRTYSLSTKSSQAHFTRLNPNLVLGMPLQGIHRIPPRRKHSSGETSPHDRGEAEQLCPLAVKAVSINLG